MNTKRIIFWIGFIVVLTLIVWGLIASMDKQAKNGDSPKVGTPAPVGASDHVRSSANASTTSAASTTVTLLEYSDFQCPACQNYYPVVEQVFASSTVPIRLVYRHFPLSQHANSTIAAQASEAAALQGRFWEMYSLLFANHT